MCLFFFIQSGRLNLSFYFIWWCICNLLNSVSPKRLALFMRFNLSFSSVSVISVFNKLLEGLGVFFILLTYFTVQIKNLTRAVPANKTQPQTWVTVLLLKTTFSLSTISHLLQKGKRLVQVLLPMLYNNK